MSFFISSKVVSLCFSSQPGKRLGLVKNISGAAKYTKIIKYKLNAIILSLKRGHYTLKYGKWRWQLIFDISYSGKRFSPKNKR